MWSLLWPWILLPLPYPVGQKSLFFTLVIIGISNNDDIWYIKERVVNEG